jgi:hypothetical protein
MFEYWSTSQAVTVPKRAWQVINTVMAKARGRSADSLADIHLLQRASTYFVSETVSSYVQQCYGTTVQSGPFHKMRYLSHASGSLLAPKILGTYEQELTFAIEALAECSVFLDVGCAEGYFAVGAAYRFPHLNVRAYDLDEAARENCAEMALMNGVEDRVAIGAECTAADIEAADGPGTLVMLDIEGAEAALLRALDAKAVARTRFIIEIHGMKEPNGEQHSTSDAVRDCFSETHDIVVIDQAPRDTRMFPELMALTQLQRYLAVWEGRGPYPWMWVTPKAG